MSVVVTSLISDNQTIDSVVIAAWARQLRAKSTAALVAAVAAKTVQMDEVDSTAGVTIQEEAPLTGATVTANDSTEVMVVKPAGTIAALTLNMPQKPYDGQPLELSTTQVITALTMAAAGGDTLAAGLSAGTANGFGKWRYSAAEKTWFRVG